MLAFLFGYAWTLLPLAKTVAFGSAIMLVISGALAIAAVAAFPVSRSLIARGRGHASAGGPAHKH